MKNFKKYQTKKLIETLLGSSDIGFTTLLIIVALMLVFAWLPDAIALMLPDETKASVMLIITVLILLAIGLYAKRLKDSYGLDIDIDKNPHQVRYLILFLSKNPSPDAYKKCETIDALDKNNFKMPLLAIQHHQTRLEKVAVIVSNESKNNFEDFKLATQKLLKDFDTTKVEQYEVKDFEDAKEVFDKIESVYNSYKNICKKESEILIDVTGGQKTVSIAASMLVLPNDRQLQYVTYSGEVKTYNLKYINE